ncbi:MAG: CehA/McbA family metallohydrolase [Patescibacteria group bacterium]
MQDPAQAYQQYQWIKVNTHSHSSDSDAIGIGSDPTQIVTQNLKHFDAVILTDHGGHLTWTEWLEQLALAMHYVVGKVCLRGFEVTGTEELSNTSTKDPAYQHGWGHLLVVNTSNYTDRRTFGNGQPPQILETFTQCKDWLIQQGGLAIFAHPSLYMIEESFDGFAPPRNHAEITHMVGCELGAHSLRFVGLGDGVTLRSSNEACFRKLLRAGWHVGAYNGGDEHIPPFGNTNTVTGMWVKTLTADGIFEAMRARRTFASEEPRAMIQLTATSSDRTAIMGETLNVEQELIVHARCLSDTSAVSRIDLVFLSSKEALQDVVQTSQPLHEKDEHWGTIVNQQDLHDHNIILVYAKAQLTNGRSLVSSPIWINEQNTP